MNKHTLHDQTSLHDPVQPPGHDIITALGFKIKHRGTVGIKHGRILHI